VGAFPRGLTPLHRFARDGSPLIVPGKIPAGGVQLRQTLFAVSSRESLLNAFSGLVTEIPNTPAGTHDGSDATIDGLETQSDGVNPGSGDLIVIYTLDSATYAGAIAFVRLVARATLDPGSFASISGLQARYGTVVTFTIGLGDPVSPVPTGFTPHNFDAPLGPGAVPWTAASINANKFGIELGIDNTFIDLETLKVSEFRLEIWG